MATTDLSNSTGGINGTSNGIFNNFNNVTITGGFNFGDNNKSYTMDMRGRNILSFKLFHSLHIRFRIRSTTIEFEDIEDLLGVNFDSTIQGITQINTDDTTDYINVDFTTSRGGLVTALVIQFRTGANGDEPVISGFYRAFQK